MPEGNSIPPRLGYCPLRQDPCSGKQCHWWLRGMKCCVIHGINSNLGKAAEMKESIQKALAKAGGE